MPAAIPLIVQRRWLAWLRQTFDQVNRDCLGSRLRPPSFELSQGTTRLGAYDRVTRTLSISVEHLVASTWVEVELTLRHEMAHQVVAELFAADDAPPHGELFARACRLVQVDRSPRGDVRPSPEAERVLAKVRKLMNLGASPNPHEAELAMAAASRLLLKHNLELADAGPQDDTSWKWLGRPTGRVSLADRLVSGILQEFFFVECVYVRTRLAATFRTATVLEVLGRHHNLAMAEYVYDYLTGTLDRLWHDYRQTTRARGNALRNDFRVGVMMGFRDHLRSQKTVQAEEGLIWRGDPALAELLSERHPRLTSMGPSRYRTGEAHQDGRREGQALRIRPGVGESGSGTRGLLGSGR